MENNDYTPEVVWASEETTPDGNPFMTVKKARGHYYYAERGGRDSIAFILFDANRKDRWGLIFESKPPMDELFEDKAMMLTAFGGSIDMDKSPEEICIIEVKEEAGYEVDDENVVCVGATLVSTQMNQSCVGFLVDVTDKTPGKTEADIKNEAQDLKDPDEFYHNKVIWLNDEELMDNNDWKSIWIAAKIVFASLKD